MTWMAGLAAAGAAIAGVGMAGAARAGEGAFAARDEGGLAFGTATLELRAEHPAGSRRAGAGFELVVSGGPPAGAAWIALEPEPGRAVLQPLSLDELGEGSLGVPWSCEGWAATAVARTWWGQPAGLARIRIEPPPPEGFQWHQSGEVVVTEFMKDPAFVPDSTGEWIEVLNRTSNVIDLEGWQLSDAGSSKHMLKNGGAGIFILPGQRLVLGNSSDRSQNGFVSVQYKYSGYSLANGADEIRLRDPLGTLVDRVAYDDGISWPDLPGRSISLSPSAGDPYLNDHGGNWCHATTPIGNGNPDTGTPGATNDPCP